ncbi:MAG: flagellar hook-associated protein FlgL [Candidatus Rokubacteria bacterium]|nr:flagellar hook-associated protein FlgL [Candidatus Rokubacteria bacterium]
MRVTQTMLTDQALAAIRQGLTRIAKNQARLASGRRLETASDDPAGHAAATRLGARLAAIEQYQRQAALGRDSLTATDTLVDGAVTLMTRAQELALSGANGTAGANERATMATEVNHLLEEAVSLANTSDGSRYLLGGRETTTAPLTVTRNGAGDITAAAWNPRGVDGSINIDVAEGFTVQTNLGGTTVLGASTDPAFLPAVLVQLRDALRANDQNAVNGLLANLQTAQTRLTDARATVGSRLQNVERALGDLDTAGLATQAALSAVVDADVARVAVELSQQEAVYQAALHAASKAIQPSLLEFLR